MTIQYTTLTEALCPAVAELIKVCFPLMPAEDQYSLADLVEMAALFPEGTIVAVDGRRVVGMGTGIFRDIDFDNLPPTENELLYLNGRSTHTPLGSYYYGSDMAVHPAYRGRRIGRAIYDRRKALVTNNNKIGFAAAAVLPGFANYKDKMTARDYVDKVIKGEYFDPTLSMQMRNGFQVVRLIKDFFVYPKSDNWSALIFWENPQKK